MFASSPSIIGKTTGSTVELSETSLTVVEAAGRTATAYAVDSVDQMVGTVTGDKSTAA